MENYTFRIVDGKTELALDMDSTKKYIDYIQKTWSKALEKVRELGGKEPGHLSCGQDYRIQHWLFQNGIHFVPVHSANRQLKFSDPYHFIVVGFNFINGYNIGPVYPDK